MNQAIHFKTSMFDVSKERENPINPIYGVSLLEWLRNELKGNLEITANEFSLLYLWGCSFIYCFKNNSKVSGVFIAFIWPLAYLYGLYILVTTLFRRTACYQAS